MKLQFNIMKSILLKNYSWILLLAIMMIAAGIFLIVRPPIIPIAEKDFLGFIAYPQIADSTFFGSLLTIYQIGLHFYIFWIFLHQELEYSKANIMLRYSSQKWLQDKISFALLFTLITKTIQVVMIYLFFLGKIPFQMKYLLSPITYNLLIISALIAQLTYHKSILLKIFLGIIVLGGLYIDNYLLSWVLISLLISIAYHKFHFKKLEF